MIILTKIGHLWQASRNGILGEAATKKRAIANLEETELFLRIIENSKKKK